MRSELIEMFAHLVVYQVRELGEVSVSVIMVDTGVSLPRSAFVPQSEMAILINFTQELKVKESMVKDRVFPLK